MDIRTFLRKAVKTVIGKAPQETANTYAGHEDPKIQIKLLLDAIKNPVIFEIGAHMGTDTKWFHENAVNPTIHCFEPDPRNADILRKSGVDKLPGVFFNEAAVGSVSGVANFHLSTGKRPDPNYTFDHTDSSSLREPTPEMMERFKWISFQQKAQVQVFTLDDYCEKNKIDSIYFIWADTQGAEVDVIKGGQKMLAKTRYLFTEYCDIPMYEGQINYEEILKILPGKWRVIKKYVDDVLLENVSLRT